MELSKANKRAARQIIETGLQKEFRQGLLEAAAILKEWENQADDSRTYYHRLFSQVKDFDKHISRRYDYMTGSKYLFIIAAQYADKVITEADLQALSPEVIAAVKLMSGE